MKIYEEKKSVYLLLKYCILLCIVLIIVYWFENNLFFIYFCVLIMKVFRYIVKWILLWIIDIKLKWICFKVGDFVYLYYLIL